MIRTSAALKSAVFVLAGVVLAVLPSPLAGQQAASIAEPVPATAPVNAPAAPLAGPRVRADLRPVEPTFSGSREPAPYHKKKDTIVISTLALVLIIVIVVLLI